MPRGKVTHLRSHSQVGGEGNTRVQAVQVEGTSYSSARLQVPHSGIWSVLRIRHIVHSTYRTCHQWFPSIWTSPALSTLVHPQGSFQISPPRGGCSELLTHRTYSIFSLMHPQCLVDIKPK